MCHLGRYVQRSDLATFAQRAFTDCMANTFIVTLYLQVLTRNASQTRGIFLVGAACLVLAITRAARPSTALLAHLWVRTIVVSTSFALRAPFFAGLRIHAMFTDSGRATIRTINAVVSRTLVDGGISK
jgi:hypothetical protein